MWNEIEKTVIQLELENCSLMLLVLYTSLPDIKQVSYCTHYNAVVMDRLTSRTVMWRAVLMQEITDQRKVLQKVYSNTFQV